MEDADLVVAAQGGNTEAFGELVNRHQRHVTAVAIANLNILSMVDDVVQESFVAAWVHRDSLKDPTKFRAWVCGIARNLASKSRRSSEKFVSEEKAKEPMTPSAEEHLLRAESENALWAALQAIPIDQREVLVLFYSEEQSIREISRALGQSESAVQKRVSRARQSVKTELRVVLESGLRSLAVRASPAAAVLAVVGVGGDALATTAVSTTASQAATSAAASLSTHVTGGILTMKTTVTAIAALSLVLIGAIAYTGSGTDDSEPNTDKVPAASTSAKTIPKAPETDSLKKRTSLAVKRIDKTERAARFAKFKEASSTPRQVSTGHSSPKARPGAQQGSPRAETKEFVRDTIREVLPLIRECYELTATDGPLLSMKVRIGMHISNEPDIAGLVTEYTMERSDGDETPINPIFSECMEETMMSVEFLDLDAELQVTYPFSFSPAPPEGAEPDDSE